jgi:hypothetical protein
MPFPKNIEELRAADYKFDNHATCRGCGEEIEWWITPKGSKMPMNPMPSASTPAVTHFSTCTEAESFRKK